MDREFEEFSSMEFGIRAGIKLVCNHIDGRVSSHQPARTIVQLINAWAPPTENNTGAYVKAVETMTGINRYQRIYSNNRQMISRIIQAMAKVETGVMLDMSLIRSAWDLL